MLSDPIADTGAPWVVGYGYIQAWTFLHRAEEALVKVSPAADVQNAAAEAELRLTGSEMGNKQLLLDRIKAARPKVNDDLNDKENLAARGEIADAIEAVNEHRDGSWSGLIEIRNRLAQTMLFTGVVAYGVLMLAVIAEIDSRFVFAAAVFYLVGAVIGLFNRLLDESNASSAIQDYGLSYVRLVVTPLLSGVAAIAGVYLIAASNAVLASVTAGVALKAPDLASVYDLATAPGWLVIAAGFGLTPSRLVSGLQDQAEKLKGAIQKSEAADGKPG